MAMTPVEVVHRALDAWNRRDLNAWVALFHEQAEMRTALEGALRGKFTHRGREEIRAVATEILNDVDVHITFRSLVRYGPFVLLLGTVGTRGRTEGAALDQPYGVMCRVDDGVIVSYESFLDHADALSSLAEHVGRATTTEREAGFTATDIDWG